MSSGDTKTDGNKGNNFPFQIGMLKLLQQILAVTGASGGTPINSSISQQYFQNADNVTTAADYQTWKTANPSSKVVSRTYMIGNGGLTGLLIEYIP